MSDEDNRPRRTADRERLSPVRALVALIACPTIGAAVIAILSSPMSYDGDFFGSTLNLWIAMCLVGVPISVAFGGVTLIVYERLGLRALWHYAVGGIAMGVAMSFLPMFFSAPLAIPLLATTTTISSVLFWVFVVWNRGSGDRRAP